MTDIIITWLNTEVDLSQVNNTKIFKLNFKFTNILLTLYIF